MIIHVTKELFLKKKFLLKIVAEPQTIRPDKYQGGDIAPFLQPLLVPHQSFSATFCMVVSLQELVERSEILDVVEKKP